MTTLRQGAEEEGKEDGEGREEGAEEVTERVPDEVVFVSSTSSSKAEGSNEGRGSGGLSTRHMLSRRVWEILVQLTLYALTLGLLPLLVPMARDGYHGKAKHMSVAGLTAFQLLYTAVGFLLESFLVLMVFPSLFGPFVWAGIPVISFTAVCVTTFVPTCVFGAEPPQGLLFVGVFTPILLLLLSAGVLAVRMDRHRAASSEDVQHPTALRSTLEAPLLPAQPAMDTSQREERRQISITRLSALSLSPYYAHYDAESILGLGDSESTVIGSAVELYGLMVVMWVSISGFYLALQFLTAQFRHIGHSSPAPLYILFAGVGHGTRVWLKFVGRSIDRRRSHGVSAEMVLDVMCYVFLYVFYRSLFFYTDSFSSFFTIKVLSAVSEIILFPLRMHPWYHIFHEALVNRDDCLGTMYRVVTYEVPTKLLMQRLQLDFAMRFTLIISSSAIYLCTFVVLRFGWNRHFFSAYAAASTTDFERTVLFTGLSVAIELIFFVFTYLYARSRTGTSLFKPLVSLFRNRSTYFLLYVLALGSTATDAYAARLRANRTAIGSC